MRAAELAEPYPLVDLDSDALEAVRILARGRLPGLVVTDRGKPHSVLAGSQVVRFLVPDYVQADPSLARVVDERAADRIAARLRGRTVRELLPTKPTRLPSVEVDDTVLELAALMARERTPIVAVVRSGEIVGVVTAARLLDLVSQVE